MATPEAPQDVVYALVELTFALADQTRSAIDKLLVELDLTHVLANALWRAGAEETRLSMSALATNLRCDPSTVTFLADRLEEKGLVERRVDPSNRRVKILELTPKGWDVRERLVRAITCGSPVSRLSTAEQNQLRRLLAKAVTADAAARGKPNC